MKKSKKRILAVNVAPELKSKLEKCIGGLEWNALENPCPKGGVEAPAGTFHTEADLIVTDLEASGMDRLEFLKCLQSHFRAQGKPVMVFSSRITPAMLAAFMGDPKTWFADKSSPDKEIKEVIRHLLGVGEKPKKRDTQNILA